MTRRHPPHLRDGNITHCARCGEPALGRVHQLPPEWPAYAGLVAMLVAVILIVELLP